MDEYTRSIANTQILRTVKDFSRILCSWTRHCRNGVRFPKYPHGCPSRLRYSGPTFHFWTRCLVSWSWTRKSRNGVHFPESSAERFTFFTSLRSSVPFLTAFPRILSSWTRAHRADVHFNKHPHDLFQVPCGVCFQWFGSERSPSYP